MRTVAWVKLVVACFAGLPRRSHGARPLIAGVPPTTVQQSFIENVKKYEFATAHFQWLDEWLQKDESVIRYQFNMLTLHDYGKFFLKLRKGDLVGFRSRLDVATAKAAGAVS
jgi:hypothetical protein